jgi:hypothetical protein
LDNHKNKLSAGTCHWNPRLRVQGVRLASLARAKWIHDRTPPTLVFALFSKLKTQHFAYKAVEWRGLNLSDISKNGAKK